MNEALLAGQDLEHFLGDPLDPASRLAWATTMARDEREEFPEEAAAALRVWGFHRHVVPRAWGGELTSYEQLFSVARSVARRDLTVAIAHGTALLGANPVWLWGSDDQRALLADRLLGGSFGSFGTTEESHGSDLLACEFRAERGQDGYTLFGEKWLIGNAHRGSFVTLFARTSKDGGPRGFSLLFVDKQALAGGWTPLPKIKTLGGRGHDLSGLRFEGARVPLGSVLGREGVGFDQTLKTLQLTRTLIAGLSLGAGDTALRLAATWASTRQLYQKPIMAIGPIADLLLGGFLDLLIGECVTVAVCRAISLAPDRLTLWSAVTKYLVPVMVENLYRDASVVLSARFFLREGMAHGIFQKMLRDHAIASVFEGTTLVNLNLIAGQLAVVLNTKANPGRSGLVEAIADLRTPAPPWDGARAGLVLFNDADEITAALPASIERALALPHPLPLDAALQRLARSLDDLRQQTRDLLKRQRTLSESSEGFELARRYCHLFAAATCVHLWVFSGAQLGAFAARGEWLVLALERLLGMPLTPSLRPPVEAELGAALSERRWFSLLNLSLGR